MSVIPVWPTPEIPSLRRLQGRVAARIDFDEDPAPINVSLMRCTVEGYAPITARRSPVLFHAINIRDGRGVIIPITKHGFDQSRTYPAPGPTSADRADADRENHVFSDPIVPTAVLDLLIRDAFVT